MYSLRPVRTSASTCCGGWVAGLLPEFSRRAIAKIFPRDTPNRPRQIEKLENAIIDTAVQWALKAYSAWQAE